MSESGTYGEMQSRIAYEILGGGLVQTTDIENAILDAVKDYERQSFYFNEIRDASNPVMDTSFNIVTDSSGNPIYDGGGWTTVPGVDFYPASYHANIGSMAFIRTLVAVLSTTRYILRPATIQWIEEQQVNPGWRALPTDWCWHAGGIRLYPFPDQAYPMIMTGIMRFPTLAATGDTNPWMVEAEELIRCAAKRRLYLHVLRNPEQAQMMQGEEQNALRNLKRESSRRAGPTRIRPHPGMWF